MVTLCSESQKGNEIPGGKGGHSAEITAPDPIYNGNVSAERRNSAGPTASRARVVQVPILYEKMRTVKHVDASLVIVAINVF